MSLSPDVWRDKNGPDWAHAQTLSSKDFPETHRQLVDDFTLEENDVIVIGSADEWIKAEYGAYAAAWTLIP